MANTPENQQRETGTNLHRRQTWRQITVPFLLGLTLLLGLFLLVGLPNNPEWRLRAEAITSLSYSFLCLVPMIFCLFIPYIIIVVGIYAMRVLRRGTERPLRKLETFTEKIAKQINQFSENIDDKAEAFDEALQPMYRALSVFDKAEEKQNESREQETS